MAVEVEVEAGRVGLDAGRLRRIDRHFARYVDDGRLPGWLALVARHGRVAHLATYGRREDVEGPGVVGQTPRLEPGQAFKYQSFCPLRTEWGTMEGSYRFRRDDGTEFDVEIGRFYLRLPDSE